jgi:HEAT repeat protein
MFLFGSPDVGKMANRGDVSGLLKAARHKDPSVSSQAVEALGSISFRKQENVSLQDAQTLVYALLMLARNDDSEQVRQAAVCSLGNIYRDLMLVLKGLLEGFLLQGDKRRPDLGDFAATVLPRIEFELETALKQDPDSNVRKTAAESLSIKWGWSSKPADTDEIAPYFYVALQEWNKCVKLGSVAVEPLISMLEDKDVHVVISAIRALARIGDARAIDALERVLQSSTDQGIKEAARKALRKFEKSKTTTSTTFEIGRAHV